MIKIDQAIKIEIEIIRIKIKMISIKIKIEIIAIKMNIKIINDCRFEEEQRV